MECSPADFAKHVGMEVDAVYKAVQDGRLGGAFRRSGRRVLIDLEAGRLLLRGFRKKSAPAIPPPSSLAGDDPPRALGEAYAGESLDESAAVEKFWKAKLAELQFKKSADQLVAVDDVHQRYASEVTACRTKLLAVVPRLRQRVSLDERTLALVDDLIREALAELGRSQGRAETADDGDG